MSARVRLLTVVAAQIFLTLTLWASPAAAVDRLCDASFEDCRAPLLTLIANEQQGIDVAFWFMEDSRFANALIARHKAGVRVRVLVDTRANTSTPNNATILSMLKDAGIPMRYCITSGILHWKTMIFAGQNTVEFSGANYSPTAFVPDTPYADYEDEVIYFTDNASLAGSFKTEYDNNWISDSKFADYANIVRPLTRRYPLFTKDPELNFVPKENFATRSVPLYQAEVAAIDVTMYRITDRRHADEMIAAVGRGVPVRLITEPLQYRDPKRYWHAWNVDRMYMAGVQIRHRAHAGLTHQKTTILYSQTTTVFGSSNWTSDSASSQIEHNYFTKSLAFFNFFVQQFERKWFNLTGTTETQPFAPLPPDPPSYVGPANGATGQPATGMKLQWKPGYWAHKADIYFGTSSNPPLLKADVAVTPTTTATYTLPTLAAGKTYYWRIVSKTMANQSASGTVRRFSTQ